MNSSANTTAASSSIFDGIFSEEGKRPWEIISQRFQRFSPEERREIDRRSREADEAERRQREEEARRKMIARTKDARIPKRFADADIQLCCGEASAYAESFDPAGSTNLVISGAVGSGKSYTACAILNEVLKANSCAFATMGDIQLEIKGSFDGSGSEKEIVGRYTDCALLVIDDLGKGKQSDWALSVLFMIVDARYRSGLPTIFTTQYDAVELVKRLASGGDFETADAIVSRMQDGAAIRLAGGDRRLRAC